jgi:hypothetical protein
MCGTRGLRHDDAEEEECPHEWGHGSLKGYATPLPKDRRGQPAMIPLLYSGAMAVNGITAPVFGRLFDR